MGINADVLRRRAVMETMRKMEQAGQQPGWNERAYCKTAPEVDPELFFPEHGGLGKAQVNQAKLICLRCSEQGSCLAKALELGENCTGVWGGTTETERRRYRTWLAKQPPQEEEESAA